MLRTSVFKLGRKLIKHHMSNKPNLQTIIMTLQDFWADQGCLIWQPYYTQVGAGTMNPGTFLRVLGPEPWKIAYVEPSIRPDDGRYGENPNRMHQHYQFQVILKPDPGNPQEIYLQSLEALGIDQREHDIRFVEDNWRQPALGAWGLGWEVWMDGQEITQFTYFQQAGGISLDPVSVELTYGLERIAIALQQVDSFRDIQWSPSLTDGDVNLQAEEEHSRYYFEVADVDRLRQMLDLYEKEAKSCLEQNLVLPAYDYILKSSHTFNAMDTRGAVGVTERQAMFARMRDLSRKVSEAYLAQREAMGFPWLVDTAGDSATTPEPEKLLVREEDGPQPFLLEIGTEELPPDDLDEALRQLNSRVPEYLQELRLEYGSFKVSGTPRRLVVYVSELSAKQTDVEQVVKGPPADRAFDENGKPTKAAQGFARSKGVPVSDLKVADIDGGKYITARIHEQGEQAVEVLARSLNDLVLSIHFERNMRWNRSNVTFSRPVRWLVSLLGENVVPFEFAGIRSGRCTRGLRFSKEPEFEVRTPEEYFSKLDDQGIVLDKQQRKQGIISQAAGLAEQKDGAIQDDPNLLSEIANLVENPVALIGEFDRVFLGLPAEVLTTVMKKHQRYLPVETGTRSDKTAGTGRLSNHFITIRNGNSCGKELVREGNEHVVRARFSDADFFIREDLKHPLAYYLPKLSSLTFQFELGSMLDKTDRIRGLMDPFAEILKIREQDLAVCKRAAELCKADLVTQMVVEMTSLQGFMGGYYARNSGEPDSVATAIREHYMPRFSGDTSPTSFAGLLVGLADRIDSLVGLFAIGKKPTGNKDPFGLRRAALGTVTNLLEWDLNFDLEAAIEASANLQPFKVTGDDKKAVAGFLGERLRNILVEQGYPYDVVDAILVAQARDPKEAVSAVRELTARVKEPDWETILPAYSRCVRITRDLDTVYVLNSDLFTAQEEMELHRALQNALRQERRAGSVDDFLTAFVPIIPFINDFFDQVLVMDEDPGLRNNRLGLLQKISGMADGVADMSRLEGF
jgi:glycyl-tRNA synthetase